MNTGVFSEAEMEAFKELGNVGAGHAAIALTQLFGKEVDMSVPFVRIGSPKEISAVLNIDNDELVGFSVTEVVDPLKYRLSVLFRRSIMINVLQLMSTTSKNEMSSKDDLTDMQKSIIQEIGSTIVLRYIAALNKMLKVESIPELAPTFEIATAITAISEVGYSSDSELILVQLDLFTDEAKFECHLFIQPHPDSVEVYRKAFFL
ncbi:MAG: chemotaxis protein CheC [Candidatus Kariarchaeaceae archaeon]|jgi:chemotaxis protein CheC